MPLYLKTTNIAEQVGGLKSVLIVPCGFCPAASIAVQQDKPYFQPLRRLLKTEAYEDFIRDMKRQLAQKGLKTDVFSITLPHHMVACMWTSGRRLKLAERAAQFEGVVVLGCDAAVETVRIALTGVDCRIIQGMESEGVMNVVPKVSFPFNISLVVKGLTSVAGDQSGLISQNSDTAYCRGARELETAVG